MAARARRGRGDDRARVEAAVRAQLDAGLELVTDGLVRWPDPAAALLDAIRAGDTGADGLLVRAWRETADVAASLAGLTRTLRRPRPPPC